MKAYLLNIFLIFNLLILPELTVFSQNKREIISFEDYAEGFLEPDDALFSSLEEWQNVIVQWLEQPVCINSDEADWLVEYKIISLYQLNKLKEYRLIYSDLLSIYELSNIDGWDFQTVRKVLPLVTVKTSGNSRIFQKFNARAINQVIVVKTSITTQKSKGYQENESQDTTESDPYFIGSPIRFSVRYDLDFRNRIVLGLRMEKDPGEPLLIEQKTLIPGLKAPDMLGGYLMIRKIGPVSTIILGNYRVSFGYGLNISGGFSGIRGRNGMGGMAGRISPHSSVSETGYFRGAAICSQAGRFTISCFGSIQNQDGTSVITDSVTGKPISFSSINNSGLHRNADEITARMSIRETVAGGFLVYGNNWLKTGLVALYNRFDANVTPGKRPYAKFGMTGHENLVAGISATAWLPKFQFLAELSMCRNKSLAILAGLQVTPSPGFTAQFVYRKFDVNYQNRFGSGYISAGANSGESGIQGKVRIELPLKYLLELLVDESWLQWVSYDLASPSRKREIRINAEKAWKNSSTVCFTFKYANSLVKDADQSSWICHTQDLNQFKARIEYRMEAFRGTWFKSRVEIAMIQDSPAGWLILEDIEIDAPRYLSKCWLRVCFFDVSNYDSRIYSYENDVLYDFSSFMHYGKGLRGVFMMRCSPVSWIDIWLRLSTIYYTNKYIGSDWDATGGNRQNEVELQVRIKLPAQ